MSTDHPQTNIASPGQNDILCGRGGGTNAHPGNIKFRKLVAAHKLRYLAASKSDKPSVARDVVREWRAMDPPGRFLAKADAKSIIPRGTGGGGDDDDGGGDDNGKRVFWHDVGDKKAREKASQCLRERNGAANEAVAALVKTVTASGEACPEDYATLMNKAALVKAKNDLTIQQQNEMLKMGQQMGQHMSQTQQNVMGGNNGYDNSGHEPFEPISLQQQQQGYGGQHQQGRNNSYHDSNVEDDLIEAEIQRLLQQRQQQLMSGQNPSNYGNGRGGEGVSMSKRSHNQVGGRGGALPTTNNNNNTTRSNGSSGGGPQPYMGEESVMREYEQLMHKQRELNIMAGKIGMGGMDNGGMNAMMNGMINGMNHGMDNGGINNGMGSMMNGMNNGMGSMMNNNNMGNNMGRMMPQAPARNNNMGMNNGMDGMGGNNFAAMQSNHNADAAKDYMNRLRLRRQGGGGTRDNQGGRGNNMADQVISSVYNNGFSGNRNNGGVGVGSDNMMNIMGNMQQQQQQQMQGKSRSGQEEFTIEEYQASLQQFLSHNDDFGAGGSSSMKNINPSSSRPDLMMPRDASQHTQQANNLTSNAGGYNNDNSNNNNAAMSATIQCIQVPTNLEDGSNKRNRRSSIRSVDDMDLPIGRNTFKSVDSNDRPSFQSMDDMDIRGTFRSVDTLDLMSIGNSINEIIEDDVKADPEAARKKYGRRLSANSRYSKTGDVPRITDFAQKMPGRTLEIKAMDHGRSSGTRGGPKKKKSAIDPRLASAGQHVTATRQSVQTKDCDGPTGGMVRGSQLSIKDLNFDGVDDDSRMSFGNISVMSELTDFQGMMARGGHQDSFKDL